jgi:HEXXH motif-containing protein
MRLERFLRWEDDVEDTPYADELDARAEQRLSAALAVAINRLPEVGNPLRELAKTLPADRVVAAAHWPELEYQLRLSQTTNDTPMGLVEALLAAFKIDLTKGMLVDFDGPAHRADVSRRFARFGSIASVARPSVEQRLGEAMALLQCGSPPAAEFTRRFTRVIVPLEVRDIHPRFGSFSSSWYPARSVLVNPHLREMSLEELAGALLHEAIHSLIDVSEIGDCLPTQGGAGAGVVSSPWTGARISLVSLVDAYFVWYGLLRFWEKACKSIAVPSAPCKTLMERCLRGFFPELPQVMGDRLPNVHPQTIAAIETLRAAVIEKD